VGGGGSGSSGGLAYCRQVKLSVFLIHGFQLHIRMLRQDRAFVLQSPLHITVLTEALWKLIAYFLTKVVTSLSLHVLCYHHYRWGGVLRSPEYHPWTVQQITPWNDNIEVEI